MEKYHDEEWGFPVRTISRHFEQLTLEIFQAGLSCANDSPQARGVPRGISGVRRPGRSPASPSGTSSAFSETPASCETAGKSRRPSGTPKGSWPSRKKRGSFNRYLASLPDDLPSLQRIFREEFVFMGPKIAEAYLESVGRIPEPHDPHCWRAEEAKRRASGGGRSSPRRERLIFINRTSFIINNLNRFIQSGTRTSPAFRFPPSICRKRS